MKRKVIIFVKNLENDSIIADIDYMYVSTIEEAMAVAKRYYRRCENSVVINVCFIDSVRLNLTIQ